MHRSRSFSTPSTVPMVWLWLVGIPANSPIAPLFPTAFEPLMMVVVKYQLLMGVAEYRAVMTATLVSVGIFVYMEFINWYVFKWVLNWERLHKVRDNRWVEWGLKHFGKAPYSMVLLFAATPIPFWVVRCLAILHDLNFTRYMIVMAIGRFPRLYIYAWLYARLESQFQVPWWVLIALAVGTGLVLILWRIVRGRPILEDTVLDG